MSRRTAVLAWILLLTTLSATPLAAQVKTEAMKHEIEGKEACLTCHKAGVVPPAPDIPETHEGRTVGTCLWCHGPDSPMVTEGASQFAHGLEGRENCVLCHAIGMMPQVPDMPESHEDREVSTCLWCHTKVGLNP